MDETFVGGKPRQTDRARWERTGATKSERTRAAREVSDQEDARLRHGAAEPHGVDRRHATSDGGESWQGGSLRRAQHSGPHRGPARRSQGLPRTRWSTPTRARPTAGCARPVGTTTRSTTPSMSTWTASLHTQTIDGFWSLVKRGIDGTHHAVSPKWLQGYLNEYVWRYNHRDDPVAMFLLLLLRAAQPTFRWGRRGLPWLGHFLQVTEDLLPGRDRDFVARWCLLCRAVPVCLCHLPPRVASSGAYSAG